MNIDKMREEFEARFSVPAGVAWSEEHQNYGWVKKSAFQKTITYRALFAGWQASRESLVIELPIPKELCGPDGSYMEYFEPEQIERCIEAAGLKVKQ